MRSSTIAARAPPARPGRRLPRRPVRPRAGVGPLRRGLRRPRPQPEAAEASINDRLAAGGPPIPWLPQPDRLRHERADRGRVGHASSRSAATSARCSPARRSGASCSPSPAPAPTSPGSPPGRPRRRRVGGQRAEGVDHARPRRPVGPARRAHRPGSGEARRSDRVRRRHAGAGRRGAPAAPDDRRGRVQRGVLHRRPHPRRRDARQSQATAGGCRSRRS